MSELFYIKKLIRDDKAVLEFDQNEIYLDEENTMIMRPEIETTAVPFTEADGGEMVAQRLAFTEQPINGLIVPKTSTFWQLHNQLTAFFVTNHSYAIIYETKDGTLLKAADAWISDNLQVPVEPKEDYSRWSVTLSLGQAVLTEYSEDEHGEETYANSVDVGLVTAATGGSEWDSVGQKWDSVGQVWEISQGGIVTITVDSTTNVYPVWEVEATAANPSIRNLDTDTQAIYTGNIAAGQKLVVDFANGTAKLDGTVVTRNLSGELKLKPGTNSIAFEIDSGTVTKSTIKWNNVVQ